MHVNFLTTAIFTTALTASGAALALDKVTFGTNWFAEPEHGGFYQAVVDGTYAKYGLEVKILPGGPQANNRLLLTSGKIEFYMVGNMLQSFDSVAQKIPTIIVAAIFQKDPQIFMSHPGVGLDKFSDLVNAPAFVGKEGTVSFYQWMKAEHGFKDEMIKPYNFNSAPFIADKKSIQQGYVTSEPLGVEKTGGFKPNIFLLADQGFTTYSTTIEARMETVEKTPDLVKRFVEASIIGWYNYMYGDNKKANDAIKKDNPDMSDEQIAFSIGKMKEYGLVDSGDTLKLGIGAMTDARMKDFYDKMVKAKVVDGAIDYKKAYTLSFVNKGVGMDLKPK